MRRRKEAAAAVASIECKVKFFSVEHHQFSGSPRLLLIVRAQNAIRKRLKATTMHRRLSTGSANQNFTRSIGSAFANCGNFSARDCTLGVSGNRKRFFKLLGSIG
jgi:hypothetical protein